MTYELNPEQKAGVLSSSIELQYSHFIGRCADWGEVWSLYNGKKWADVTEDDGLKSFPAWPHPEYALDCRSGGWEGFEARAIEVHDFIDMCENVFQRDGVLVRPR